MNITFKNKFKVGLSILALFLLSCEKEKEPKPVGSPHSSNPLIHGRVLEFYTEEPIPYAWVSFRESDGWGSWSIVHSLQTDENGEFTIEREFLQQLAGSSTSSCAGAPPDATDEYSPYEECVGINLNLDDEVAYHLYPLAWLNFKVHDVGTPNPEITEISSGPTGTDGSMQYSPPFYPTYYDETVGLQYTIPGYYEVTIPFLFITGSDGISGNDSLIFKTFFVNGQQTLEVPIEY